MVCIHKTTVNKYHIYINSLSYITYIHIIFTKWKFKSESTFLFIKSYQQIIFELNVIWLNLDVVNEYPVIQHETSLDKYKGLEWLEIKLPILLNWGQIFH